MTTRHLVDPELLPLIDAAPAGPINDDNLAATRAIMAARFATLPRPLIPPMRHLAPGRRGAPAVAVLVYDPAPDASAMRPGILHLHGGGMIAGSAELTVFGTAPIALGLGCVVISVDYRLAPETPFPGPLDDCYAALEWAFANARSLRIDPDRIMVSGDSAGGGLAAALAIMNRDIGKCRLAAQFLTYPMLDHRTGGADDPYRNPVTGEFMWTRERNQFGWSAYRGEGAIDVTRAVWFSPALAQDLTGLPRTWIGTGSLDLFFDENLDFARRLVAAGVATDFHSYAGGIHGFNAIPNAAVSQRFASEFGKAIQTRMQC